jgi:hypothetical protein
MHFSQICNVSAGKKVLYYRRVCIFRLQKADENSHNHFNTIAFDTEVSTKYRVKFSAYL